MSASDRVDVADGGVDFSDFAEIVFPGLASVGGVYPVRGKG